MKNYFHLYPNQEKLKNIPVILVIVHLVCFILTSFNFYNETFFNILTELIDTSLITCGVFIILSKIFNWNNFIRKNINILISFNLINLFIDPTTNIHYHNIYMWLIIVYFLYLIIYTKYHNGRKVENN